MYWKVEHMSEKGKFMSNLHLMMNKYEANVSCDMNELDSFYEFCQNYGVKKDVNVLAGEQDEK